MGQVVSQLHCQFLELERGSFRRIAILFFVALKPLVSLITRFAAHSAYSGYTRGSRNLKMGGSACSLKCLRTCDCGIRDLRSYDCDLKKEGSTEPLERMRAEG